MDAASLYQQLGRILEQAPDFSGYGPLTQDQLVWIGRAHALIKAAKDPSALIEFEIASKGVQSGQRLESFERVTLVLYKVLGSAELAAPPHVKGTFIPAGNSFDAFAAITKLFKTATADILVVDPYMDETVLTEFGGIASEGVRLRLLTDSASARPSLAPAAKKWVAQYGPSRPLGVRNAPERSLHDRAIFIDAISAWTLTQSLKDFAKRAPAEIVRNNETDRRKIAAYEAMWQSASVIV